jgi:hypothetical protein
LVSTSLPSGTITSLGVTPSSGELIDGAVGDVALGQGPIAVDPNGAIYVAVRDGSVIRRIYNGAVNTVAGTAWIDETEIGPGPGKIYYPTGVAYDAASNSLIIMTYNAILRAQLPP